MKSCLLIALIAVLFCADLRATEVGNPIDPSGPNRKLREMAKEMKLDRPPEFLRGFAPRYPPGMVFQNKSGHAIVEFTISVDGTARDIKIIKTSDERLSVNIIGAIRGWKFKPAEKDGKPVDLRIRIPQNFVLFR